MNNHICDDDSSDESHQKIYSSFVIEASILESKLNTLNPINFSTTTTSCEDVEPPGKWQDIISVGKCVDANVDIHNKQLATFIDCIYMNHENANTQCRYPAQPQESPHQ